MDSVHLLSQHHKIRLSWVKHICKTIDKPPALLSVLLTRHLLSVLSTCHWWSVTALSLIRHSTPIHIGSPTTITHTSHNIYKIRHVFTNNDLQETQIFLIGSKDTICLRKFDKTYLMLVAGLAPGSCFPYPSCIWASWLSSLPKNHLKWWLLFGF